MSGRRRRSEPSWERKDEKWSNLETNDDMPPGNFSGRQSWERLQGNRNVSEDGDFSRDRHRMQTDPGFDDWEKQYSSRPSDDNYNMPCRARDRVTGGHARMSRDQDQTRSPNRSRSRSPGRGGARDMSRSRSRSRNRDWEITRARSRSPLYDDRRHESNEYPSIRNNSRLSSRSGGKQLDDNLTENRSRRPDHTSGSRYNDYQRDDRNVYDDQNKRHQTSRNSRVACKFFMAGNCTRDDCRFSHDVPESGHHDGRSHDNSRDQNLRKNKEWHGRHPHDDDLNPSDFSDIPKSNFGDKKQKTWDGPTWDDMESGGFDHKSRDNIQGHKSDDKRNLWDRPSRDGSGFPDVGKSNFSSDNKNRSGNGSARDKKSWNDANSDDKKKFWDRPSWDDVDAAPGYPDVNKPKPSSDYKNRPENIPSWDSKNHEDGKKSWNDANSDEKKRLWDRPTWDDVDAAPGFPDVNKPKPSSDYKNRTGNIPSWDSKNHEDEKKSWNGVQSGNNIDGITKKWDGPLWDEVDFGKASVGDGTSSATDDKIRKFDGPGFNEMASKKNEYILPQWTTATKGTGLESHAMDGQTQHVMSQPLSSQYVNATVAMIPEVPIGSSHLKHQIQEHSNQQMLASGNESIQNVHDIYLTGTRNPFNGSNSQSNGQVQGGPQAKNDVNALPASLPELSQQGQLPQLYTDLNLTGAIDFLKSLPKSACNEDTRANEEQNTATAMDVKASVPIGILSGSITQEKEPVGNLEGTDNKVVENDKQQQETMNLHNTETQGKEEEGDVGNDEKAMRQFKVALVEFAKEILKPKWKEGKLSRDVHKTVVKKVVDKVTSTIQGNQIPRTQAKIEQYLSYSKPKITKLVEAYVERLLKA
ncbi:zinc finger, CCCH-type [Artemisia annua]|uniref:Zinc finger, CCCH-type n=1 Tax=Artemisia annua TaxID=35608 RepID=A0A2U1NWS2_ARTAN|nr:zinc finger, CCCH-type [Artemisia annua]